jgi:hypothetical protein
VHRDALTIFGLQLFQTGRAQKVHFMPWALIAAACSLRYVGIRYLTMEVVLRRSHRFPKSRCRFLVTKVSSSVDCWLPRQEAASTVFVAAIACSELRWNARRARMASTLSVQ